MNVLRCKNESMQYRHRCSLLAAAVLASVAASAETVVLRNGYRLQVTGYDAGVNKARLRYSNGGWIEVPIEQVLRVDRDSPSGPGTPAGPSGAPRAAPLPTLDDEIDRLARESSLPPELVRAVIWAESGDRQDAVSPKGAIGLMQLMPVTAAGLGVDPRDPMENLEGGTRYLRQLLERYSGEADQLARALAAYNAGPGRVAEHGGLPPYPETAGYVAKVVRRFLRATDPVAGDGAETAR